NAPGKIVVNSRRGDDEGNVHGRVARLPEDPGFIAERIRRLAERAKILNMTRTLPPTAVLGGLDQPLLSEDRQLLGALSGQVQGRAGERERLAREPMRGGGLGLPWWQAAERPIALWVGQRYSMHEQALVVLRRKPGQHLVIVGEEVRGRYGILAGVL